jgi:hypothetical protein
MKIYTVLWVILELTCTSLFAQPYAEEDKNQGINARLGAQFRLISKSDNLYEINDGFVLRPIFSENKKLISIQIAPKYFFEKNHPEWSEPESTPTIPLEMYRKLLSRIQTVERLGNLVHKGTVGITMNVRTSFWDEYSGAIIERAMFRKTPEEKYRVAWFTIWFLREIVGKIDSKEMAQAGLRVRVDSKWFMVPTGKYNSLVEGARVSLKAAGPLDATVLGK